jgi:hypothetical protein
VTDLADACRTKSQAEVTKDFVNAASFMLSVTLKGKGKKAAALAQAKRGEPLWDASKIDKDQWLSQTAYLTVRAIEGPRITVENSFGN